MFKGGRYIRLSNEEISLISEYRANKKITTQDTKNFENLIDDKNKQSSNFIFSSKNLYTFLNKIFSSYLTWCNKNDVCFSCSLNRMINIVLEKKGTITYLDQDNDSEVTQKHSRSLH